MIDPRKITPLLSNMTVDREIGRGPNGTVYLVTRRLDGKKMALKHIPIPASDAQTKALIFAGAVKNEADAQRYYNSLVKDIKAELLLLNGIKNASNLLKFRGYQVDVKFVGMGFDVYLLADYCKTLPEYLTAHPLTKLQAVNLAIDLCTGLEQLRSAGLVHKDIRPNNIYLGDNRHFLLGDLGIAKLEELEYSSMPDQLLTDYTAPEVVPADAILSPTMDIYSVGMILYEIYNGGLLPVGESDRFIRTDAELPAPAYADMALSEIILRACSFDPEARYQTPAEMKQALVLYMQRGNISNEPLVPPPPPAEDDATVDVATIAATVAAGQAAEEAEKAGIAAEDAEPDGAPILDEDNPDTAETPESVLAGAFQVDEPEETPKVSLNDLSDDDLLVPTEGEISVEDFLASIRSTPGLEVLSMDNQGNTVTVPGYETEETLPEDTEYVDSADNHAEFPDTSSDEAADSDDSGEASPEAENTESDANAESESAASDPAAEPDGAPAYIAEDTAKAPEADTPQDETPEEPQPPKRPRRKRRPEPEPEELSYDDGYEDDEDDEEDESSGSTWKKVLISVIVLLVLAGGAFGLYVFKTDTVELMNSQVLSSTSIQIQAETKNNSAMEVVCSTAVGEVARLPYTENGATFTDLKPNTAYSFSLESAAGKLLLGSKALDARTNQMTNLTGFGATSISAVSANLALSGTGPQPESWVVTVTSDDGQAVTATSSDVQISVEGLKPATTYTATIARGDGDVLGGTTTCTFTTMDYTTLTSFDTKTVTTDSVTVQWVYEGTVPDTWTVTCEGTDGSTTTQEVSGTECTLDGLSSGVTYTVTLSCASLKETDISTINASVPSVTITDISSVQNEDGNIEVSWEYTSDVTPTQWSIAYSYESATPVTPTLVTSDKNSVVLENLVPDANYTITVQSADDLKVGGTAETTCVTGEAEDYTNYGCSDASMTLYVLEDNPDELETSSDTFTTSQHVAFAIEVSYEATEEEKSAKTLYVIRDENGLPLYVYSSSRSWSGTWLTARHKGNLPDMPQTPGSYTLEVYFDGDFLASADFTVTAE